MYLRRINLFKKASRPGNSLSLLGHSGGQVVVEYVLILLLTVMITLGVVYQLNDAFRVWMESYFGDYVACLLETGEVPSLGGPVTTGLCNQQFQEFSLENGRPVVSGGSGAGGSSKGDRTARTPGVGREETGGGEGGATAGSGGGRGRVNAFRPSRGGGSRGSSQGQTSRFKKDKEYTGSTDAIRAPSQGSEGGVGTLETKAGPRRGFLVPNDDKEEKNRRGSIKVTTGKTQNKKNQRIKVRKLAQVEAPPEDQGMTFGGFLRYLVIAAIIIALLIFLGGQAIQINKSME